jgi:hypothetical protein
VLLLVDARPALDVLGLHDDLVAAQRPDVHVAERVALDPLLEVLRGRDLRERGGRHADAAP